MATVVRPEGLTLGLCLVALGVLWTLSNLGWLDLVETLRRWWPSTLVAWGAIELANTYFARSRRPS